MALPGDGRGPILLPGGGGASSERATQARRSVPHDEPPGNGWFAPSPDGSAAKAWGTPRQPGCHGALGYHWGPRGGPRDDAEGPDRAREPQKPRRPARRAPAQPLGAVSVVLPSTS